MKSRRKSKLYLLIYNKSILAISSDLEKLQKYIMQFKEFFLINQEKFYYECEEDSKRISFLINRYQDQLFIRDFSKNILLTDMEISYYKKTFESLYSDFKRMMATTLKMDQLLNIDLKLKASIMENFDKLYENIRSYETFLDTLNKDMIFDHYISNPLETRWMIDMEHELEWSYHKNMEKDD